MAAARAKMSAAPTRRFRPVPRAVQYRLLGAAPVVVVSALTKEGARPAACTVAWVMALDYDPPKAALVMGADHATTKAARTAGELVINIPGAELADAVFAIGSTSSKKCNKWKRFGLTHLPSKKVKAPGIAEALAVLECRILEQETPLGRELAAKYDLVLVEIVAARAVAETFKERWRPEDGAAILHHLGGRRFSPSREVVTAAKPR